MDEFAIIYKMTKNAKNDKKILNKTKYILESFFYYVA